MTIVNVDLSDFQKGDKVWTECGQNGYPVPGRVFDNDEAEGIVIVEPIFDKQNLITITDPRKLKPRMTDNFDFDDLIQMDEMSEAAILWNLKKRYDVDKIYTYIGSILISLNPYKMTDIYRSDIVAQYRGKHFGSIPPHLFAIGDSMYTKMLTSKDEQVVVISGESGSGKTEACKLLMQYLAAATATSSSHSPKPSLTTERILDATPILESFGNARTIRNDNSSRFGKYTEIFFKQGFIHGASITEYMLEKSRIVTQAPGERNYHIFYQLLRGLKPELKEKFGLYSAEKYFYLNQGKCVEIPGRSDSNGFKRVESAFEVLGFTTDQQHTIFRLLASILHLGNVYFHRQPLSHQQEGVQIGNESEVQWAAYLLQLDPERLKQALTAKFTEARDECVSTPLDIDRALDVRDAIAKGLYAQLFSWLVSRINQICFKEDKDSSIALLDIYGFERFKENSFEQLCINYANERLHSYFVDAVFRSEQAEYAKEKILWQESIGSQLDNWRTLDILIKRPYGIFHLMDDESNFPKGTDESFLQKCHYNHVDNPLYGKPRMNNPEFCVRHYAGAVWYKVPGFLDKNRDILKGNLVELLIESQNATLSHMFKPLRDGTVTRSGTVKPRLLTVSAGFNDSLNLLLQNMSKCKPHFVRCIKPNNDKQGRVFDTQLVLDQLRYLGILDTLKIRKLGYPTRFSFDTFSRRYGSIVLNNALEGKNAKDATYLILTQLGHRYSDQYQIGSSKVFLKEALQEHLENCRDSVVKQAAVTIQKYTKAYLGRKKYRKMKFATVKLQSAVRGWHARNQYVRMKADMYKDAEKQAKQSRRLKVYEELQGKRAQQNQDCKKRMVTSVDHLEVPKDLDGLLKSTTDSTSRKLEQKVVRFHGEITHCQPLHSLPHDLHEFPFANFAQAYCKGHTWQMRREPITTPFLPKETDEDFQESLRIFKLILRFMNDSVLNGAQEALLADYVIQQGLSREALRDEIYVQIVNQTRQNPNSKNEERGWLLLGLCASAFPPSPGLFKFVLNYANDCTCDKYGAIITRLLLQSAYGDNGDDRRYPPCMLEHKAMRLKARMAMEARLSDGEKSQGQIDAWCTSSEFAERILRQKGIADVKGWTVSLEAPDLDIFLGGKDYVLDVMSYLELPREFPASRPNFIVAANPAVSKAGKDRLSRKIQEIHNHQQRNGLVSPNQLPSSDESVPSEPKHSPKETQFSPSPPPHPTTMQQMSDDQVPQNENTLKARYNAVRAELSNSFDQSAQKKTQWNGRENSRPTYKPPEIPNLSQKPQMIPTPPPPPPPETLSNRFDWRKMKQQKPSLAHNRDSETQQCGTSTAFSGSTASGAHVLGVNGDIPDVVLPPVDYNSSIRHYDLENESVYAPPSQASTIDGVPESSRYCRSGRIPSEYSAMSIASHVRKVQIPSKNSDVDKFLDELFDPVLQDSTMEDIYDLKSIAASIKGGVDQYSSSGANQDNTGSLNDRQTREQPVMNGGQMGISMMSMPQMNQPMIMMVPMDPRMFGSIQQMQSSWNPATSTSDQQHFQFQPLNQSMDRMSMSSATTSTMPYVPFQFSTFMPMVNSGMMPMQLNSSNQNLSRDNVLNDMMSRAAVSQQNGQHPSSYGGEDHAQRIPSPPTLPPEPSFPAPPAPPQPGGPAPLPPPLTAYEMEQRAKTVRVNNIRWPPKAEEVVQQRSRDSQHRLDYEQQNHYQESRNGHTAQLQSSEPNDGAQLYSYNNDQEFDNRQYSQFLIGKMKPSSATARYIGPSEDTEVRRIGHSIRDTVTGAREEPLPYLPPRDLPYSEHDIERRRRDYELHQRRDYEQRRDYDERREVDDRRHFPSPSPDYRFYQRTVAEMNAGEEPHHAPEMKERRPDASAFRPQDTIRKSEPNRFAMQRPMDSERELQKEALAKLRDQSKNLPPPVDEVRFFRGVPASQRSPAYKTREESPVNTPSRPPSPEDRQEPPEPPAHQTEEFREEKRPAPELDDWVNEEDEVVRETVQRRERPLTTATAQHRSMEDTKHTQDHRHTNGHRESHPIEIKPQKLPVIAEESQEKRSKGPVYGYGNVPWEITVRKELFYPGEHLEDPKELDLVFYQVVRDCFKRNPFRIRSYERDQMMHLLKSYHITPENMTTGQIPLMVKRAVVECAREWPLYFCRLFPVVEDRSSEFVAQLLGVSETGVRLIVRNYDAIDEPLKIIDHFDFEDVDMVEVPEPRLLRLVTVRGLQVRVFTEKADQIKQLIDDFLFGPNQGKQYVRAVTDYISKEPNLLKFRKGDLIQLVSNVQQTNKDNQPGAGWLYGKLNNAYGNFPSDYVQPVDPHGVPFTPNDAGSVLDEIEEEMDEQWVQSNGGSSGAQSGAKSKGGKLTMMEFAMMYFRHAPQKFEMVRGEDGNLKGTLKKEDRKSKKEWTWKEIADQVKFQKTPLQASLLRLESAEYNKMAMDCFVSTMRYMGDFPLKKGQTMTDCVYELLMVCHRNPPMRDEIYCQVMKQTTNNKSGRPDSAIKGWRLFSILSAYFDCSDVLKPYLFKYLSDSAGDTRRAYHGTAMVCLQNLKKTFKYGGRKFLLGAKEIEAITLGKNLKRQIYHLPGGHKKVVNTKAVTVVEEIIQDLCHELNIRSPLEQQEFCLCYILESENAMKLLSNDEYVLDVTTELEHKQKEYFLLLKRTVWIHPLRLDNELYIDVMFFQLVPDYLEGLLVTMRSPETISAAVMDDIARLGALLHRGDEEWRGQTVDSRSVSQLLPRIVQNVRHVPLEQWADRVTSKLTQLPQTMTSSEARAKFLEVLQGWPLFGSTFFYIMNVTDSRVSGECLLAINRHGIQFLHIITHEILLEFRLTEVLSTHKVTAAPPMGGPPMQFLDLKVGNLLQQRVVTLQTEQGTEISRLLGQYIYVDSQNRNFINGEMRTDGY